VLALALLPAACGGSAPAGSPQTPRAALPGPALAPAALPALPERGLAVWRPGGVVLRSLDGRVLGHLAGFRPVRDHAWPPGRVGLQGSDGRLYLLDGRGLEPATGLGRFPGLGCHVNEAPYVVCFHERRPSTVRRAGRVVLGPAGREGHWESARLSPDGRTLLLQWSAECEIPVAYFATANGRRLRPVVPGGPDSRALGWSADGRAVVLLPLTSCAGGPDKGIFLVNPGTGRKQLLARGEGALWAGSGG
jgi:hypothetical protein